MNTEKWLLCPICENKTRLKIGEDTELKNFPLFCPKCKQETLISVKEMNTTVIKEPAAQNVGTIWAPLVIFTPPQQTQKETPQT